MIYISTGGESSRTGYETACSLIDGGIRNIELSGGVHNKDQIKQLSKLKNSVNFQVHNYFPPPKNPFVLNLAAKDKNIATLSLEHISNALNCAAELDSNVYSFHAGFLIDLQPSELGKRVKPRPLLDRHEAMLRFIDRVNKIDDYAQSLGIKLLIENNVLSENNLSNFGCDPFLMANMSDYDKVMSNTSSNVRLLVDVAHLKVSAKSLGYSPEKFLKDSSKWIEAYHLSDNDGTKDSNNEISEGSWFWKHLDKNIELFTIEVYHASSEELLSQMRLTEKFLKKH